MFAPVVTLPFDMSPCTRCRSSTAMVQSPMKIFCSTMALWTLRTYMMPTMLTCCRTSQNISRLHLRDCKLSMVKQTCCRLCNRCLATSIAVSCLELGNVHLHDCKVLSVTIHVLHLSACGACIYCGESSLVLECSLSYVVFIAYVSVPGQVSLPLSRAPRLGDMESCTFLYACNFYRTFCQGTCNHSSTTVWFHSLPLCKLSIREISRTLFGLSAVLHGPKTKSAATQDNFHAASGKANTRRVVTHNY